MWSMAYSDNRDSTKESNFTKTLSRTHLCWHTFSETMCECHRDMWRLSGRGPRLDDR
jgi:hypothetical protein